MHEVKNWQIGRTMPFPYPEVHPKNQFAFVFNINRCIGCQTCALACKTTWTFQKGQEAMWWSNVESKPYGGYPRAWDSKILGMLDAQAPEGMVWKKGVYQGPTIFEAGPKNPDSPQVALGYLPTDEEWSAPNIHEDSSTIVDGDHLLGISKEGAALPTHKTWFFHLQRVCNHCTYPSCLAACPNKAIYKRPEDGIVLVDQDRCRGTRKCVEACPYKKAMYRPTTRKAEKCNGCLPRIEGKDPLSKGNPMAAACMTGCPGQVQLQGLVRINPDGGWAEDRQNPLYYLIKVAKVALPLYPQFGTEPNGYYIPPRWVPRDYLKQMFGPGVDAAIEKYTAPDRELQAVLQMFGRSQTIIHRYEIKEGKKVYETERGGKKFEVYDDTVIAYGKDGQELFRTKIEEPLNVRADKHSNSI